MALDKKVTMLPAKKRIGNTVKQEDKKRLRVAAYCRVSTDSEEQATSYEAQIEHYTTFIKNNSEWELAGVFADDGISGTNTKKREEFNRLIKECMAGNIDMVITKSISRFARNTLDCLRYIRQLKDKNIPVFFEKENINSMDAKGEVMLTIMASLAQQESQSLSQNVKLGLQYRYQNGEVQVNHNRFLGYTKDENRHLIIEPTEAEVVKRIYREYLEGSSLGQIGKSLEADNILTAAKKPTWRAGAIKKILENEKYIGDALLQKTYTVDFLNKKRVINDGFVPQYYVENNHEAIIPRTLYIQVQEEMKRRSNLHTGKTNKKRVYSNKYALSGIVYCSNCGDTYRRVAWNNHGNRAVVWRCKGRIEHGPKHCNAPTIFETDLQDTVVKAINQTLDDRGNVLQTLQENIEQVLKNNGKLSATEIEAKLEQLQEKLLKRINRREDYNDIVEEIDRLREVKQDILLQDAVNEGIKERINEMADFLGKQTEDLDAYDEQLVRQLLEKIVVYDDEIEVKFKSGMSWKSKI